MNKKLPTELNQLGVFLYPGKDSNFHDLAVGSVWMIYRVLRLIVYCCISHSQANSTFCSIVVVSFQGIMISFLDQITTLKSVNYIPLLYQFNQII